MRAIMSVEQPPISKGGILWDRFHLLPVLDAVWVAKSPSPILEMIFFNAFSFLLCMYWEIEQRTKSYGKHGKIPSNVTLSMIVLYYKTLLVFCKVAKLNISLSLFPMGSDRQIAVFHKINNAYRSLRSCCIL